MFPAVEIFLEACPYCSSLIVNYTRVSINITKTKLKLRFEKKGKNKQDQNSQKQLNRISLIFCIILLNEKDENLQFCQFT